MTQFRNGRYQLLDELGQGGMGIVYRAHDRLLMRDVALKQITLQSTQLQFMSQVETGTDHKVLLTHEFRTLAALRHPNIISVLDYGFDEHRQPFFTMDLLDEARPLDVLQVDYPLDQRVDYLIQVLQALIYLHRHGILHRDIKPGNVLVQGNHVYLVDFGLAVNAAHIQEQESAGTLGYLAPEVLRGQHPSVQSDLYSIGVIAYEVLMGHSPYDTRSSALLLQDVLNKTPTFDDADLPDALVWMLSRLLSKDPEDRYTTALATMQALCDAVGRPLPVETAAIRDSFLSFPKFVGRENEMQQLTAALQSVLEGKGQAYLIGGESGVGKSRLMDEIRVQSLVQGATVLYGQAVSEGGRPYELWRATVRYLLLLVDVNDDEALILSWMLPDIARLLQRELSTSLPDASSLQKRLPLVILSLLRRAADRQTMLILLEDLQWADPGSLELLKQVIASELPVFVVGNYRSDEAPNLPRQLSGCELITLSRFEPAEIRQLSTAILGDVAKKPEVLQLVETESEGNAFFITEVLRTLAEEAGQLDHIGVMTLPAQVFAGGVRRVVERRLKHLPAWTREPLEIAAVIGRQIDQAVMALLYPDLDLESWLNAAAEAAVLSVQDQTWRFAHDKLREHVLSSLDEPHLKTLHARAAAALETVHADALDDYATVLVGHYAAAGNHAKEAEFAVRAADHSLFYQPRAALVHARRAIELAAYNQFGDPLREHARLYKVIGQANLRIGRYEDARQALDRSLALYQQAQDTHGIAVIEMTIGEWGYMTGNFDEALPLLEKCLPVLEAAEDWMNVGFTYMNMGIIQSSLAQSDEAKSLFERSLNAMQRTGDEISIAQAMNNLAISYEMAGDRERAITMHQEALEIRRRLQDQRGIAFSLANLAAILIDQGNEDRALPMLEEAVALLRQADYARGLGNVLNTLAKQALNHGDLVVALQYNEEAVAIADRIANPALQVSARHTMGDILTKMDDPQAMYFYHQALRDASNAGIKPLILQILHVLALRQRDQGYVSEAVQWLSLITQYPQDYNGVQSAQEALDAIGAKLDAMLFERLVESGKQLDLDSLVADVLAKDTNNDA